VHECEDLQEQTLTHGPTLVVPRVPDHVLDGPRLELRDLDRATNDHVYSPEPLRAILLQSPPFQSSCTKRPMGSVIKKRRKAMNKHKHRKRLKKERWQRRHG
jgi:hypothetical protein